ncbi:AI-2E family transporter [Microbacterium sp. C7(2022)]|uniref:AI-2E family transporter n=1 Tax=Microbacterium sp. C7(2022) TaxID=2992759 RepID=UPI00237B5A2B|nr:AI-2E family transporter [Microbacterium sp. C7(2022)]MDE0546477.1 AI-2E family transporter [Microbacterium sp. C7(2022)]
MKRAAPTPPAAPAQPLLSPTVSVLLGLAAAVIALAGLYFARELVGPLVLAAVLVIICHPVRFPFERRGWPSWAATTMVIVVAYLILAVMVALLFFAGTQFARLVVDYADQLEQTVDETLALLQSLGIEQQAADGAASLLDPSTILSFASSLSGTVLGVLTAFFFLVAYIIFMAADGARYARAGQHFGASIRPTVTRVTVFNAGVRRYYVVNATFGAIVAIIDGLALWALGVPAPAVWAILAFVTNFVPNIGFVLGLIPPAILALVIGGWPMFFAVVAIYCVVNVTLQVLIQPKFVSDAVNLSLTLSFFSVIFWTFIIGPLGAILSIPLTLLVRALVLEGDPSKKWLRWLSGDVDAVDHPVPTAQGDTPPAR